jgi:cell filamentation protein
VVFDPFGDFATRGYLRNYAGETNLDIVKQLEHRAFQENLIQAMDNIAKAVSVGYADVLTTHQTLFSGVYPWAGTDRMRNAADIVITKAGYTDLFAHPLHIPQVLGWALSKGADLDFMRERPGSVMGALAHAHPFLDGNGRTIMVVHYELAARAGIAIAWDQTNKADYLQALTEELQQPEARRLDFYLKPFIRQAVERQSATRPC